MKIKALVWTKVDWWSAKSPAGNRGGSLLISYEEGRYWPLWVNEPINGEFVGFDTIEEAQAFGQKTHDEFVRSLLEPEQEIHFSSDMKMLREMQGRDITLTFRIGYPGSRVSDLMIGPHRIQIDNDLIVKACSAARVTEPRKKVEFAIDDRVEVISGIHEGKKGRIIEQGRDNSPSRSEYWLVEFDDRAPDCREFEGKYWCYRDEIAPE